ncbi:MAG: nucleotide exchange factor GrpE [Rhodospirillaceae bacterium]|nr:nucleotide exchange factor GrpE [Rhodospirillaceae bacterium]
MNEEKENKDVKLDEGTVEEETSLEEAVELQNDDEGEVKESSSSLDELEAKILELKDQLLRTVADSENLRKRLEREKEQTRKFGIANFAKDLLSIADNLGRALDAAPNNEDVKDQAIENLVLGIQMTEQELQKAFDNNNIRKIDPLGEKFDYNFHQAMFEVEETDQEPGTVVQVLQPGYAIDDRILRPAMVGVAANKAEKKNVAVDTTA